MLDIAIDRAMTSPLGFSTTLHCMEAMTTSTPTHHECEISREVATLARHYCALIDSSSADQKRWLIGVKEMLPRLHAIVASVETDQEYLEHDTRVDLDARFELFTLLRMLLGDRDSYWLEFDCAADGVEAMTGSLADDLTDIYCELQQGLRIYESNPHHAIAAWASGYVQHWGEHLIDAERHLAQLGAQSRLEP